MIEGDRKEFIEKLWRNVKELIKNCKQFCYNTINNILMAYLKIIGIGIYFNIHVPLCILNNIYVLNENKYD